MGTKRTVDTGRVDSLGRKIKKSDSVKASEGSGAEFLVPDDFASNVMEDHYVESYKYIDSILTPLENTRGFSFYDSHTGDMVPAYVVKEDFAADPESVHDYRIRIDLGFEDRAVRSANIRVLGLDRDIPGPWYMDPESDSVSAPLDALVNPKDVDTKLVSALYSLHSGETSVLDDEYYRLEQEKWDALDAGDLIKVNQLEALLNEKYFEEHATGEHVKIDVSSLQGVIAVDIDDTIGSFEMDMRLALAKRDGLSYEEAMKRYPGNQPGGIADWWSDADDPGEKSYQEFLDVEARGLLYKDQPVRAGAGETINWLHKHSNGRVEFLTARRAQFNEVSERWLRERVGIDFPIKISNSNSKEFVPGYDLLIDDSAEHVRNVTSDDAPLGSRKVVFMTRPRSDKLVSDHQNVHRAWTWQDVRQILT